MSEIDNFLGIAVPPDTMEGFLDDFSPIRESLWFYDHTIEVVYDDVEHTYHRVGDLGQLILLMNVSTVTHIIDRTPALIPWAAKVTVEKLIRIIPVIDGRINLTLEEFTAYCMEAKKAHKETLEDAGEVGKMAHKWIEKYIKRLLAKESTEDMFPVNCEDNRATNAVEAALHWMKRHNVRWLATERKVYSKTHDCSGTMDGRCLVDSCDDPLCCPTPFKDRHTLADWKTSNHLKVEYLFQTAAYEGFYEEEFPNDPVIDRWVLRLGKEDGEFEPWHLTPEDFEDDYNGFLACLALKRLVEKVEDRTSDRKKYVREARKEARKVEKALAKEKEKVEKAIKKAEEKLKKEQEKKRIQAEAKAERERLKQELKKEKQNEPRPTDSDVASGSHNSSVRVDEEIKLPVIPTEGE